MAMEGGILTFYKGMSIAIETVVVKGNAGLCTLFRSERTFAFEKLLFGK